MKKGVFRGLSALGMMALVLSVLPCEARADIVKRELYTNAQGKKVSGYVFQSNRRWTRPGRVSGYYYGGDYFYPWVRHRVVIVPRPHPRGRCRW